MRGLVAAALWQPMGAGAAGAAATPPGFRPWTAWECSPGHRLARIAAADREQSERAQVASSRLAPERWSSAIRKATIVGAPPNEWLVPDSVDGSDPRVALAWLVNRSEVGAAPGGVADDLRELQKRASPEVGARIRTAAHAVELRSLGAQDLGADDQSRMREIASELLRLQSVPEAVLTGAAALVELAAIDPASRSDALREAARSLARLDAVGEDLGSLARPGSLFGIATDDAGTLLVVEDPDSLGKELERAWPVFVRRAMPGLVPERILRAKPLSLRQAVGAAARTEPRPSSIIVLRSSVGGGVDREDRLLGDSLRGGRALPVHVVALVPDPEKVSEADIDADRACEFARRSGGSLRAVAREGVIRAASATPVQLWQQRGMWDAALARQRAAIELAIAVLGGGGPAAGDAQAALAPLSPDPVAPEIEHGDGSDWRMLLLAAALPGGESERPGRLLRAAEVLAREADQLQELVRRGGASAGVSEAIVPMFREMAARCLLLRSIALEPEQGRSALADGMRRAEDLSVSSGTWSGMLLRLSTGWAASVRASRCIDPSMPDAALRRWELAAVEHLFRGGPAPEEAPDGIGLAAWEVAVFGDGLRRVNAAPQPAQSEQTQ